MAKKPLTRDELLAHLDEQIEFLNRSAEAFDTGFKGEAKRLAVSVRVLVHDTRNSASLLGQLAMKSGKFLDSAFEIKAGNLVPHGGLVYMALGAGAEYVAQLDDVPETRLVEFDQWWSEPVFVDKSGNKLSRRDVILTSADQDGGAHVDPALDEAFAALASGSSMGWISNENGAQKPIAGPQKAAIRQIAHELLKSLVPEYQKKPVVSASMIFGGMSVVASAAVKPKDSLPPLPPGTRKVGRNERCPCGSGDKYKFCHYGVA
ncbi:MULTISPECIES: SEC-C metal-binding domain-containing protein [unclassified Mesorhizobium]|uniref:SEC-C metal-binding domain-containing protein n=1 Tax=unclassified Mesorhizobium TaxID=325217 RepID=UPI000FCBD8D5|nr:MULTISPECIES: SEC-C metal-binding domain-containing protein [unclassified Mesorhizobium]RUY28880.1 hypothetical protein EN979_11865 [Mesorhizobium sp. M7A.F.Ca.US.001.04.2.1]RUY42423.1 hypothetical protein EN978_12230 [Mesorhizobium sp. M7A.F.Ca.US.001.04.1.1]RVA06762.1 hypothetical protein EN938_05105 [Mesorhizobium sp. M7A.F.Ca.US.001.02.1.1]